MKLAWLTDIHLNFIESDERQNFYNEIGAQCDRVVITGDIAEATSVKDILCEMVNCINKPIYFVLGNHDYYRGQINPVRSEMTALSEENKNLFWLPACGIQKLDKNTYMVGQDGWADGRFGDYQNSRVGLNDSRLIADLFQEKILGKNHLLEKMQQLADEDAKRLHADLMLAISKKPKKIIVLTHVPPFKESCMHQGKISDDDWLPYFSSKIIGDVLLQVAERNSAIEFLVFCGHTHSKSEYRPLKNLVIEAGKAEYSQPEIQKIILI